MAYQRLATGTIPHMEKLFINTLWPIKDWLQGPFHTWRDYLLIHYGPLNDTVPHMEKPFSNFKYTMPIKE